jgi:hypothetical protein
MSLDLYRTGTLLRKPGGNVEVPVEQKAAGIAWATLNVGVDIGRDPTVWDYQRQLYRQHAIPHGPWMHVRSMDDLVYLLDVAMDWQADLVGPNLEDVVGDKLSLQEVGGYLLDFWVNPQGKPVHMPTLPWVQNDQGWQHVAFAYLALEMFPLEGDGQLYLDEYERCIEHAFTEGAKRVTLLYSTTSARSEYPAGVAHCLYTADNVTDWSAWHDTVPQVPPKPKEEPSVPTLPSLTVKQFPYTGPLVVGDMNRASVEGLKRGLIRGGYLDQPLGSETDDFGPELETAFKKLQRAEGIKPASGKYGRNTWLAMRALRVPAGAPNQGAYAMDAKALAYVKQDALVRCYPHPLGALSEICQGLHPTAGLTGNWAIDFCAPGGTKVLAVERATIRKLSGRAPSLGWYGPGIFGYSIHYETANGYRYFSTHYGSRSALTIGQVVEVGQVVGTVGHWPGDPSRSHTHLGVTSPLGETDAKKRITEISMAPHLSA